MDSDIYKFMLSYILTPVSILKYLKRKVVPEIPIHTTFYMYKVIFTFQSEFLVNIEYHIQKLDVKYLLIIKTYIIYDQNTVYGYRQDTSAYWVYTLLCSNKYKQTQIDNVHRMINKVQYNMMFIYSYNLYIFMTINVFHAA